MSKSPILPITHYTLTHPDTQPPYRENETDPENSICITKKFGNRTMDNFQEYNEYTLSCKFYPAPGYYLEICPTDQLLRAGYEMTSKKIIYSPDCDDRILLKKYKDSDDLNLPFTNGLIGIFHECKYMLLHSRASEIKNMDKPTISTVPETNQISKRTATKKVIIF